ncbi:unnamed protein product [Pocillopora meandrina]|uniref:MRG domain-containing protein n=1 Tax=Pocillopora meandrina TaxID=46732 RepID=A0AAU9W7A2_9CNID|nr:unnamed protein product [Pocillopora meandrina]
MCGLIETCNFMVYCMVSIPPFLTNQTKQYCSYCLNTIHKTKALLSILDAEPRRVRESLTNSCQGAAWVFGLQMILKLFSFGRKSKKSRKRTDKQGGDSEKPLKRESVVDAPGPARKKRSRIVNPIESDENYISRVDVKITIPDDLKQWLIDDWDLVTRQKQLVPIPRKKNIKEILDEYIKSRTANPDEGFKPGVVQEVADGIQEYFNVMLGTQLLYKFERTQYGDILAEHTNLPMSHLYGAEHLLRLFVKLGNALSFSNLDEKSVQFVVTHIQDFLDYLSKKADSLFTTDYETATPEYHRRAAT